MLTSTDHYMRLKKTTTVISTIIGIPQHFISDTTTECSMFSTSV